MIAKRTFFGAALLGCTLLSAAPAETPDKLPKPTTYVADFAGVIDATSKQTIEQLATQVYEKAHATIVVVTVKSLDGQNIDEWTTALEDKWKVGPKNTDKGILMVFAIGDHKDRIEVGAGLEGILNDAKVGDIGRQMVPALQATHYDEATKIGLREVSRVIAADAGVAIDGLEAPAEQETQTAPPEATPPPARSPFLAALLIAFTLGPVLLFIALFIWRVKHGMRMASGISGSGSDGSSGRDIFSDSSGGSDDSFSGGDGGSSGGGGAGGDW